MPLSRLRQAERGLERMLMDGPYHCNGDGVQEIVSKSGLA